MRDVKKSDHSHIAFDRLIEDMRRRVQKAPGSAEELAEFAGRSFERFVEALLHEVLSGAVPDAGIRRRFADGLEAAGSALREVLADCRDRHSVSQALQCKMFEAETTLRRALKARVAGVAPAARLGGVLIGP
jgi:hypothetical protein